MARTPQDPAIKMKEILDVAERLFFLNGYDCTTISDIAKNLGVAQGMLYYYFQSKEELLGILINKHVESLLAVVKKAPSFVDASPSRKIELLISALICNVRDKESFFLNILYDDRNAHIRETVERQIRQAVGKCLAQIIKSGKQARQFEIADLETALDFLLRCLSLLVEAIYLQLSAQQFSNRLVMANRLIEDILGVKPGTINLKLQYNP